MEPILVQTSFGEREDAMRIAKILLKKRLIACAQITGPGTSLYWWQGKIEYADELILVMKSSRACYAELEEIILEHHPYETPEILAVSVSQGNSAYLGWLAGELKS